MTELNWQNLVFELVPFVCADIQSSPKDWHIFSTSKNPKMCQSLGWISFCQKSLFLNRENINEGMFWTSFTGRPKSRLKPIKIWKHQHQRVRNWDNIRGVSNYKTKKCVYKRGTRDFSAQKFNYKTEISIIKHIFVL